MVTVAGSGIGEARPADEAMLDVIVRFHDIERLSELSRCVFSIVCQAYQPVTVWLCTQRFSADEIDAVQGALAPVMALAEGIRLQIVNFAAAEPRDARSALLNMGMRRGAGRYLAFLDYDDVIYPNGYRLLIDELNASGAAIAFGAVVVKYVDVGVGVEVTTGKGRPFRGQNLRDLFEDNFCPIHSYVIDRAVICGTEAAAQLHFDESMTRLEDYDFLLRLCAAYPASFRTCDTVVGDYYWKNDNSNTVSTDSRVDDDNAAAWRLTRETVEARRGTILISDSVQRSLGIERSDPTLTIRRFLDATGEAPR